MPDQKSGDSGPRSARAGEALKDRITHILDGEGAGADQFRRADVLAQLQDCKP